MLRYRAEWTCHSTSRRRFAQALTSSATSAFGSRYAKECLTRAQSSAVADRQTASDNGRGDILEPINGTGYTWVEGLASEVTMDSTIDMLEAAALSLPQAERARLAAMLLASLDQDPRIEQAWVAEVRDRIAAYDRGEIKSVPADEVLARAREIVGL